MPTERVVVRQNIVALGNAPSGFVLRDRFTGVEVFCPCHVRVVHRDDGTIGAILIGCIIQRKSCSETEVGQKINLPVDISRHAIVCSQVVVSSCLSIDKWVPYLRALNIG